MGGGRNFVDGGGLFVGFLWLVVLYGCGMLCYCVIVFWFVFLGYGLFYDRCVDVLWV